MARRAERGVSLEDALTGRVQAVQSRLLWAAIGLLAVLVGLASIFVWQQYRDAKREAVRELRARAVLAATVFDTYFTGELQALSAIAASNAVVTGDTRRMTAYFARFRPGTATTFTAGVGWIDANGRQRATSDPSGPIDASFTDRSYFSRVMATGKPFVSEAIVGRESTRRLLVMAVPTRDARGHLTGVLAGGLVLRPSRQDARSIDLGYSGLSVIDRRNQQITRSDLAPPANGPLLREMRAEREGALSGTHGLDGSDGRVVAFATAAKPGWTTVLDQPASAVFADARRALALEIALIGAAALLVLALALWASGRARRHLRDSREQVKRWADFTSALNEAATRDEVVDTLGRALVAEYPESLAVVEAGDGSTDDARQTFPFPGTRSPLALPTDSVARAAADVVEGASTPVAHPTARALDASEDLRRVREAGAHAFYGFPLGSGELRQPDAVVLLFGSEQALASHHASLAQAYVDQAGQALERVRRHQHEHDTAVLLQRSLLPASLSSPDGIEIGTHYRAGTVHTQVGGDWYDVVHRSDGIVHLTVGDVAGRGIDAAVAMGQLRTAFRAYALEHVSPGAIVTRLARHLEQDDMATVVCVAYDPYTGELAYASAGHPPPLLVDDETGIVSRLEHTVRGPLGWAEAAPRADGTAVLAATATLVLYTDGLVERRAEPLEDGIERLAAAVVDTLSLRPREAVEAIVDRMVDTRAGDDLAVLVARLEAAPALLRIELPAESRVLRGLRRRVDAWLALRGFDDDARADAVLALNEACANAIEHAYADEAGTIVVRLDHTSDRLAIAVEDEGRWREPNGDEARGRGFAIMRNLMDTADVVRRPTGTTVVLERQL